MGIVIFIHIKSIIETKIPSTFGSILPYDLEVLTTEMNKGETRNRITYGNFFVCEWPGYVISIFIQLTGTQSHSYTEYKEIW